MSEIPISARIPVGMIRTYQRLLSPVLGRNCRFSPTCSRYAIDALQTYGLVKGFVLAIRRIGRCHPLGGSGYDPVPTQRQPNV